MTKASLGIEIFDDLLQVSLRREMTENASVLSIEVEPIINKNKQDV